MSPGVSYPGGRSSIFSETDIAGEQAVKKSNV